MKAAVRKSLPLWALAAAAALLAGCGRKEEPAPAPSPVPAASAPASAPASAASVAAPAGPIVAPMQVVAPSDAQRTAGATLAAQGGGPSVAACNSCHGAQGEGNAASGFPRIAGQSHAYLLHELESYANGSRKHPVMQPIAAAMTPEQRTDAAAYFASLAPVAAASSGAASAPGSSSAPARGGAGGRGELLAARGDNAIGVQACINCHGPGGIGAGEMNPFLAGQHASYLNATLEAWRDGSRNNDPSGQMPLIAKSLDAADVKAVAQYYAAQPPRTGAIDAERMAAAAFTPQPVVTSGPQAQASNSTSSTGAPGVEQGAATSGGSQGPGGGGGTGPASTGAPLGTTPSSAPPASAAR